jgi:hypothetical protein
MQLCFGLLLLPEECYSQLYPGAEALSETVQHIVDIIEDSK